MRAALYALYAPRKKGRTDNSVILISETADAANTADAILSITVHFSALESI